MTVANGMKVAVEYTVKLEDGTVVDTNVGGEPLTFTQGSHEIIPGLEKEMEGMNVGESKQVKVPPEQAYGEVNPQAVQEVPRQQIPVDDLEVGSNLEGRDATGRTVRARVKDLKGENVVLDLNHPLAGKTLQFEVKVVDIQPPVQ